MRHGIRMRYSMPPVKRRVSSSAPVDDPADDITCYSLNSINAAQYRDEIAAADCLTIVGGPHATACPDEVAEYADYVIVGEGEFTLPRLLARYPGWRGRENSRCDDRRMVSTGRYQRPA